MSTLSPLIIEPNTLYILSGPPASGKSSFLRDLQLPEGSVLSTDTLRIQLYGTKPTWNAQTQREHRHLYGWDGDNSPIVFELIQQMLHARMRERLITFIDATSSTDADRNVWAKIAREYHVPVKVIIFDAPLDELKRRNDERSQRVEPGAIEHFHRSLQRSSTLPYERYQNQPVEMHVPSIDNQKLDVVSDTHGLFDEFLELVKQAGYQHDANGVPFHPDGRTLVFQGDVVDRGRQSLLMLHYVEQACRIGGHYFVPGNHEDKLYKSWKQWHRTGEAKGRSRSSTETLLELMRLPYHEQERLMEFVNAQPTYRILKNQDSAYVCLHSDVTHFDPWSTPRGAMMYGASDWGKIDSDAEYQHGFDAGWNKYILLRGHIPQITPQSAAISLEQKQAYSGYLTLLPLDTFTTACKTMPTQDAVHHTLVRYKSEFNYNDYMAYHFAAADALRKYAKMGVVTKITDKGSGMQVYDIAELAKLQQEKLIRQTPDESGQLNIVKYNNRVFYDNLWDSHPFLKKARGLVLDMAGHIIQHPFDKVFNYGENKAGLTVPDDALVDAVEKLNGFLGCITKHPLRRELLVTTTGSFTSDYVKMIQSLLTPEKTERLLKHFEELEQNDVRKGQSLMFEVIHPDDQEHPIAYDPKDQGLWLIGARGRDINAQLESEAYLDMLGQELDFRRPKTFRVTFGEVRKWAKEHDIEGYMVRKVDSGETLVKFKTTYYLSMKFLGRLSEKNIPFMYKNPQAFKQRMDEEYWPLVDIVLQQYPTEDAFKAIPREQRMATIRDIISQMRVDQEAAPDEVRTGLNVDAPTPD